MDDLTMIMLLFGGGVALVAAALLVVMPGRLFRTETPKRSVEDQLSGRP